MKTLEERFNDKWDADPETGCHLWTAAKTNNGYGQIRIDGRSDAAHRVAYELAHGPIPEGEGYHGTCVLHSCDTPACVNPAHLFLGTHADNMTDMIDKGRCAQPKGAGHWNAKLKEHEPYAIRMLVGMGLRQSEAAEMYGISQPQVSSICSGRFW